ASIARLKSDEPLYRTLVDALPQAVATVLTDGTIVYANAHLGRLVGISEDALLGAGLLDFVAEDDRARMSAVLRRAVGTPQQMDVAFRCVDGEAPALVSAIRLPISGVDTVGVVIVDARDQIARQAAEEASRAKDDLLAAVSHELRTPLTSIMGWVQLLELEFAETPRLDLAIKNLKNAVLAQSRIVDDLLDLSRSEKGSLNLRPRDFNLCEAIQVALSFVDLQARNKAVGVNVEMPEALPCHGDPDRLRQVFVNLFSNAVKFTYEGEVHVRAAREDGHLRVEVKDSGIGISADFLPFVFEPFSRGDRAKGFAGLGIGLAISRRIVEAHGGSISVDSDGPDKGATFTLRLPVA
ncbi:MAG TPA: PAS domain-containing sensor histidine kinase, partial [Thermoanaerobaculia bacterium]